MYKLGLEKAEEPEVKLSAFVGSWRKQGNSRKYICVIDYTKASDCVDHNKLWKILKEMEIPDHLTCLLRNQFAGQEVTEPDMEQIEHGSNLGKVYIKPVFIVTLLI